MLGVPLAAFQVSALAGFALTGAVPHEPSQLVVPLGFTRLGAVLDLSLLVPAYLSTYARADALFRSQLSFWRWVENRPISINITISDANHDPSSGG